MRVFNATESKKQASMLVGVLFCMLVVQDMKEEGLYNMEPPIRKTIPSGMLPRRYNRDGVESHSCKKNKVHHHGLRQESLVVRDLVEASYERDINGWLLMNDMEF